MKVCGMGVFLYGFSRCFYVAFLCFGYLFLKEVPFQFCGWWWFAFWGQGWEYVLRYKVSKLLEIH